MRTPSLFSSFLLSLEVGSLVVFDLFMTLQRVQRSLNLCSGSSGYVIISIYHPRYILSFIVNFCASRYIKLKFIIFLLSVNMIDQNLLYFVESTSSSGYIIISIYQYVLFLIVNVYACCYMKALQLVLAVWSAKSILDYMQLGRRGKLGFHPSARITKSLVIRLLACFTCDQIMMYIILWAIKATACSWSLASMDKACCWSCHSLSLSLFCGQSRSDHFYEKYGNSIQ